MTLNLQTPFPTFGGSTGGWLRAAEIEEKYAITWTMWNAVYNGIDYRIVKS